MQVILDIVQSVVDIIFYFIPYERAHDLEKNELKIVCHRGWHDNQQIMENTMESFARAKEHKMWGVEFDIRWTNDDVPVVCHDATTARVFEKDIQIAHISFQNLRSEVPEIPTLSEVVEEYGKKLHLFIELKEVNFSRADIYKRKLQESLKNLEAGKDFHFLALSMTPILKLDAFDLKHYLLVANTNYQSLSEQTIAHGVGGITGHYLLFTNDYIQRHKEQNQLVGTGFIRTPNVLSRELKRDVDFIFTNHPWNLKDY